MKTVRDICQYIGSVIVRRPVCIETGTMYTCPPGNESHNTTSNLLEYVCAPSEGILYSIDIDPEHIDFSREYCKGKGRVYYVEDDSVTYLKWLVELMDRMPAPYNTYNVDLLCLDSKEFDEDHMVNEYNAIKDQLAEKHFVLVDDIHNPNSVKWKKMVPLLKDLSYSYIEVPTPTGMFVAAKGYTL